MSYLIGVIYISHLGSEQFIFYVFTYLINSIIGNN
jgi:hypothetical protein